MIQELAVRNALFHDIQILVTSYCPNVSDFESCVGYVCFWLDSVVRGMHSFH
jgi:hypothetical protein